jgi:hypothetical protein
MHGPGEDGALQGRLCALEDVVLAKGAFGACRFRDCLLEAAFPNAAAVDDAGLVQMNVGLDKARDDQGAADCFDGTGVGKVWGDGGDFAVGEWEIYSAASCPPR